MKKLHIIVLSLSFVNFNSLFGQVHTLIPNKGIEGVPIIVDTSTISDVIKFYGNNCYRDDYMLKYEEIGLTFTFSPYDKNQIIRSIAVETPFEAKTINGITLNESTMNDILNLYNDRGCIVSENCAFHCQNGISFFVKKDPNEKWYKPNEKIYKIEINNDDAKSGLSSKVNFEFNHQPIEEKLSEILTILKTDTVSLSTLDLFWEKEEKTEYTPYKLRKRTNFKREIENNLSQENIEIWLVGTYYDLNIIKLRNDLIYLKFTDDEGNILFEYNNSKMDFSDIDFDYYVYGTFCSVGGLPPKKCKEMLNFVNEKNYNQLAKWVKSINPELATYGYAGLYFLKRQGVKLRPAELKRMKELEISDIQLNICDGCFFGVAKKISEMVNKNNLKQNYLHFKQYRWLE